MPRTIILGFDAADPRLIDKWVSEGHLPNIAKLKKFGAGGPVRSTIQPLTPIAWSTVVTGVNPGKHGVFDWHERDPQTYNAPLVNAFSVKAPTLWQRASRAGQTAGVFNVPLTYPPRKVNGWLVTDILTPPGAKNVTYPDGLRAELDAASGGYRIFFGVTYQEGDEQKFLDELHDALERRRKALLHVMKTHPTDFLMAVFMESDHVMHYFWKYMDESHPSYKPEYAPFKNAIRDVYVHLDQVLGDVLATMDGDTTLLLVSDHGSGPYYGHVYVNKLLMQNGLLAVKRSPATRLKLWLARNKIVERVYGALRSIGIDMRPLFSKRVRQLAMQSGLGERDIDWSRTQAYISGDFGHLTVNLQGREKHGIVDPRDKESVLDEVIRLLDTLVDEDGRKLLDKVWRAPALFKGPYLENAPDLMFSFRDFTYKGMAGLGLRAEGIVDRASFAKGEISGSHSLHGIFYATGPGIRRGVSVEGLEMAQIAPTALYALGLPISSQIDGALAEKLYEPEWLKTHPILRVHEDEITPGGESEEGYDREGLKQVEDRLKGLGYME